MTVNLRNFPFHRGVIVGQLKSFVGLSASAFRWFCVVMCWLMFELAVQVLSRSFTMHFSTPSPRLHPALVLTVVLLCRPIPFLLFLGIGMSALAVVCR